MAVTETDHSMLVSRIVDLREARNWSQKHLADRLAINKVTMNKIERGKRSVTSEELVGFARTFDVTTDYLLSINQQYLANSHESIDLQTWLTNPAATSSISFAGTALTSEESEKLRIALTQIFWGRVAQIKHHDHNQISLEQADV